MQTIYEPTGRAKEYSPLALNHIRGCNHGCKYCFNKCMPWANKGEFDKPRPRIGIFDSLINKVRRMHGDPREVLLCFTCDPFPNNKDCLSLTSEVLSVLSLGNMRVQVLTKGGTRACDSFGIIKRNNWKFATSLSFINDDLRKEWEPGAASIEDRIEAIMEARRQGIQTWVSVEPVIFPFEALAVIERLGPYVDFWKIGKINHFPELERNINWKEFLRMASEALTGCNAMFKRDLLAAAGVLSKHI